MAAKGIKVRDTISAGGVETPVERQGALHFTQMCEPHNCSDHQWTIANRVPHGPAAVCLHESALMGGEGRGFIEGQLIGRTSGCWPGTFTAVPDAVFMKLAKRGPAMRR